MQKASWIALAVLVALIGFLGINYALSGSGAERLDRQKATAWLEKMRMAAERKDVGTIMNAIAPQSEARIADVNPDKFRLLLMRAFRTMGSVRIQTSNIRFEGGEGDEAELSFYLVVRNVSPEMVAEDYKGDITVRLRRVDVPRMLGLFQGKEWRVVEAHSSGPSLSTFGE
jgi:hypothetical protein